MNKLRVWRLFLLTHEPDGYKGQYAEAWSDERGHQHLPLHPLVPPPVFLNAEEALVPIHIREREVGALENVDNLVTDP